MIHGYTAKVSRARGGNAEGFCVRLVVRSRLMKGKKKRIEVGMNEENLCNERMVSRFSLLVAM